MSSFKHQFQVNSVPFTDTIPTRLNIKKRREYVRYRTLSNQNNINLSYLIGDEVTPTNNFFISDKSTSLTQNRIPSSQQVTVDSTKSISVNVDKFLITDVFTEETSTKAATPLFFVHKLKNFNSDLEDFSELSLLSIEFANYNFNPIELDEYVLDVSEGLVYNNIENEYDSNSGTIDVTFVKYTVRQISGSTQTINVYRELVNNSPIFEQATFDDIDSFGILKTDVKKYLIEPQPGFSSFLVTLPVFAQYAYKETPESRIKVLPPAATNLSLPWYPRITNGQFVTSLQASDTTFRNYKYYIPEFNSQIFNPYPPYKLIIEQEATYISSNIIKVPKKLVLDTAIGLNIELIVEDREGNTKYAYTTDEEKLQYLFEGSIQYVNGILSIDGPNGFIELVNSIHDDDKVTVSYYVEENEYEFNFIDFNPSNNLEILNQRIVIYVVPESTQTGQLTQSLYYLVVNTLGQIIYSSQAASDSDDAITSKMTLEDFNSSTGQPYVNFYYDRESTASGLNYRFGGDPTYREEFSFVDKYTVDSVLLTADVVSGAGAEENFEDNSRLLVLADIYVGEGESAGDLSRFDIRIPGGGIKEDNLQQALNQQPEVSWYWDLNARRSYPGVGAFMAEVPQTLLTGHGGNFTMDQINDVIERHMKMGGYAVVKTYGIDPVITDITTTSGEVTFSWPSYGSEVTYNVYSSVSIDSGFTRDNNILITDVPTGNEYTISGVSASTKYFVKIGAIDSDGDESFGTTVSATTLTSISS
jgi:hypothetical protein